MSEEKQIDMITELLIDFDEMGFIPTTTVPNPEAYAIDWKNKLTKALEGYRRIPDNIGDFSDGYHTFNELYHHRAVLFSVICNMFHEKAWKSKLHDTGDMYEGMFIVGIETEQGQATYHYDIEPYWDMFKVKKLEKAPKYDGHTPSDAIARIGNLPCESYRKQSEWISVEDRLPNKDDIYLVCLSGLPADFDRFVLFEDEDFEGYFEHSKVTHWLPIPEAPKMKGGAE